MQSIRIPYTYMNVGRSIHAFAIRDGCLQKTVTSPNTLLPACKCHITSPIIFRLHETADTVLATADDISKWGISSVCAQRIQLNVDNRRYKCLSMEWRVCVRLCETCVRSPVSRLFFCSVLLSGFIVYYIRCTNTRTPYTYGAVCMP